VEEVLGLLGFSLGATVGMSLVRGVSGGMRPMMVKLFKAGLAAGDVARGAATRVGTSVSSATAEARENLGDLRAEARAEREAGGARSSDARKIEIVRP
jgi:hypothetical protein